MSFNSDQERKFLSKKDILIVAVILAAAAVIYLLSGVLTNKNAAAAEILFDSKVVKTVQLKPGIRETFAVPGQPNVTVEVADGKIRFLESTCRDKICIHAGWLSHPGEMAACLPNRVAVRIVGAAGAPPGQADTYIN